MLSQQKELDVNSVSTVSNDGKASVCMTRLGQ
jgi:hypothetical protein